MHSPSQLRERYLRLRHVSTEVNDRLIKRFSKNDVEQAAKELGLLRDGTLVLDSMDQSAVLFDYCIYNVYRDGKNAVQRFMEECPPADGSEERLVLEAQSRAWYSVFGISKTIPGIGAEADDVFRQSRHLLVDVSMSKCDCQGGMIATRVIPFDGYIITGGAGLPLGGEEMRDAFLGALKGVCFEQNISSFRRLTAEQDKELTRAIIRSALSGGASSFISYEDPKSAARVGEQRRQPAVLAARARVGRNEPCPCGSGKKFKVCCGR
jgi:hypothetical protein